jgi:hypothetical protein
MSSQHCRRLAANHTKVGARFAAAALNGLPAFLCLPAFSHAAGNHERDHPHTGDVLNDRSSDSGGECNVPYTYR